MSAPGESLRCAEAAQARGDVRAATAPPAERLLLVEQPGPWGRDAVRESPLPRDVGAALIERAASVAARVLLIRAIGRSPKRTPRRWALVDTRQGHECGWWGWWRDPGELLELPLDGSAGAASARATYLVCTHGRHDTCCAVRGRPVAAAFAAVRPDDTWECSHVGGDRFAANVVIAPYGLYYGHLPATAVPDLVRDTDAGRLDLAYLRGRTCFAGPVQAAQHHARVALGERRIDALPLLRTSPREEDTWRITLDHDGRAVEVVVRATLTASEGRLTCAAVRPGHVHGFELVSLTLEK